MSLLSNTNRHHVKDSSSLSQLGSVLVLIHAYPMRGTWPLFSLLEVCASGLSQLWDPQWPCKEPTVNSHYSMMPVLITVALQHLAIREAWLASSIYSLCGFIKCHSCHSQKMTGAQDIACGPGHHRILRAWLTPAAISPIPLSAIFLLSWALISSQHSN